MLYLPVQEFLVFIATAWMVAKNGVVNSLKLFITVAAVRHLGFLEIDILNYHYCLEVQRV